MVNVAKSVRSGVACALGLVMVLAASPVSAVPAKATPGGSCPVVGKSAKAGKFKYTCEDVGGRTAWVMKSGPKYPAYEIKYIRYYSQGVVERAAEVECRMRDGIMVASALGLLGDAYDALANKAKYPPKVKKADYYARAQTLAQFSDQAADEWLAQDEVSATARFQTVWNETPALLNMINGSLGTNYQLATIATC